MTDLHPITPPPELVQQWAISSPIQPSDESWAYELFIAYQAAQWGADQELEACVKWLIENHYTETPVNLFRARRPKPPSLAEQALELINKIQGDKKMWQLDELDVVRAALERLQELEKGDG